MMAILLVGTGATFLVPCGRRSILRAAGWALVANDALAPVDAIVVTLDVDGAGVLEAGDLIHNGVAGRVAVFAEQTNPMIEREFIRRGVPYENRAARDIRELRELGVTNAQQIPTEVSGTEDQGQALADWCDQHQFRSILVVSASDHSRRLRRVLHRALKDHPTRVSVCSTRYSEFDPNRWWLTHHGIRTEIQELEKLLLDIIRHPIS
jgi:hypothetical protein